MAPVGRLIHVPREASYEFPHWDETLPELGVHTPPPLTVVDNPEFLPNNELLNPPAKGLLWQHRVMGSKAIWNHRLLIWLVNRIFTNQRVALTIQNLSTTDDYRIFRFDADDIGLEEFRYDDRSVVYGDRGSRLPSALLAGNLRMRTDVTQETISHQATDDEDQQTAKFIYGWDATAKERPQGVKRMTQFGVQAEFWVQNVTSSSPPSYILRVVYGGTGFSDAQLAAIKPPTDNILPPQRTHEQNPALGTVRHPRGSWAHSVLHARMEYVLTRNSRAKAFDFAVRGARDSGYLGDDSLHGTSDQAFDNPATFGAQWEVEVKVSNRCPAGPLHIYLQARGARGFIGATEVSSLVPGEPPYRPITRWVIEAPDDQHQGTGYIGQIRMKEGENRFFIRVAVGGYSATPFRLTLSRVARV